MSRPLRLEFPGAVWHLYNRGVNRQDIFFDEVDRKLFLTILARTVRRYGWLVHAWVEMTNHYHLIVETPQTNLSAGMHDLDGDYAQAVNRRHGRVGHLFQSRFRDALVERESHLLELIRYVVLNPVRARMVESPASWPWSSYAATAGLASPPDWLSVRWTLDQFDPWDRTEAHRLYRQFVAEGIGLSRSPWEDLRSGLYLGSVEFGQKLQRLVGSRASQPEYPRARRDPARPTLEELRSAVCTVCQVTPQQLQRSQRSERGRSFCSLSSSLNPSRTSFRGSGVQAQTVRPYRPTVGQPRSNPVFSGLVGDFLFVDLLQRCRGRANFSRCQSTVQKIGSGQGVGPVPGPGWPKLVPSLAVECEAWTWKTEWSG